MRKILSAALTGMLVLCSCTSTTQNSGKQSIKVKVQKVSLSQETVALPYVGQVEALSSTMASFTGMGTLTSVLYGEGQSVSKGQVLATIDPTQATSALEAASAALEQAKDAWNRLKQLHDQGSLPDMSWVEIESKLQQAQSTYDICQKNLQDCTLKAPVSGVVGPGVMHVGETALPSEPVMSILDIHNVKVAVSVPEQEISAITNGSATKVTVDALKGQSFKGGRIEKGVSADALTHSYQVRILLDNPSRQLLPGMVCKVLFQNEPEGSGNILLPVKAIQRNQSGDLFVWVVRSQEAQRQSVTIGNLVGNDAVILSGVSEGDLVIVEGYQKVSQNAPVEF